MLREEAHSLEKPVPEAGLYAARVEYRPGVLPARKPSCR